jgi:hypothetical protein
VKNVTTKSSLYSGLCLSKERKTASIISLNCQFKVEIMCRDLVQNPHMMGEGAGCSCSCTGSQTGTPFLSGLLPQALLMCITSKLFLNIEKDWDAYGNIYCQVR